MSATTTTRHYLDPAELRELPAGSIIARESVEEVWESRATANGREGWATGRTRKVVRELRLGRRYPKTREATQLREDRSDFCGCRVPYNGSGNYYLVEAGR